MDYGLRKSLIHMGELHLVRPALSLSILDAGILIMVQQVRLINDHVLIEHGGLPHVLPLAGHLVAYIVSAPGQCQFRLILGPGLDNYRQQQGYYPWPTEL